MGCGGSKDGSQNGSPDSGSHAGLPAYDRRPKISVRIGPQVRQKHEDGQGQVIFIFGGPGSRKGRIVDDLVNSYGFKFLCCEDIILEELPRKMSNSIKLENIKEIRDFIEDQPSHVTMEWVFECLDRRLERDGFKSNYLVDFLPNFKYLLRLPDLIKDCEACMESFEKKYQVAFALNLSIPADKVMKSRDNACTTKGGEKMKEGGQSDEADSSRTQRRVESYDKCVKTFLDYFSKTDRLVTVDVTCGKADLIWLGVHRILCDLDFLPGRTVNTVLLFLFDAADVEEIDLERYHMEKLELREICEEPQGDVENILGSLSKTVDARSKQTDGFVVSCAETSVNPQNIKERENKPITFFEVDVGPLEKFLTGGPKNLKTTPQLRNYKAVASLENEICLFPLGTEDIVCSRITAHMAADRHIK